METINPHQSDYETFYCKFIYNPETGILYSRHLKRPISAKTTCGYTCVYVGAKRFQGHRVAWLLHYGEWPKSHIDHINGDRSDNRIANLRECSHQQNIQNRPAFKNNKLGVKGVSMFKNLYRAQLWHNGCFVLRKDFSTLEDASAAYQAKAQEVFGEWHRAA